jgi:molecular chaperone GrpE
MFKKIKNIMSKKNIPVTDDNPANGQDATVDQVTAETTGETPVVEEMTKEDEMAAQIADLEAQVAELKDKYLRKVAEFTNFKRRSVNEKLDMMKTAAQDTLSALLPVLDDFDRAKKVAEDDSTTEVFPEGVSLVYHKLYKTLEQKGLKPMHSTGEVFDADLHEAITEIPAPTEDMRGKVIDTVEQGYYLKDKIIRYAKVVVGK